MRRYYFRSLRPFSASLRTAAFSSFRACSKYVRADSNFMRRSCFNASRRSVELVLINRLPRIGTHRSASLASPMRRSATADSSATLSSSWRLSNCSSDLAGSYLMSPSESATLRRTSASVSLSMVISTGPACPAGRSPSAPATSARTSADSSVAAFSNTGRNSTNSRPPSASITSSRTSGSVDSSAARSASFAFASPAFARAASNSAASRRLPSSFPDKSATVRSNSSTEGSASRFARAASISRSNSSSDTLILVDAP